MTADQIWYQYDVSQWIKGDIDWQTKYRNDSQLIANYGTGILDIVYGKDNLRQSLDLFVADIGYDSPVLIFIHGGFWKANSKDNRRFPAHIMNRNGITWCPINYRLAPTARISDMVEDVQSAVSWVYKNAKSYKCDPEKIFISGNSAGAHLAAMLMSMNWYDRFHVPKNIIKGYCLISGIYDLNPLLYTEAQQWLAMDNETVDKYSPINFTKFAEVPTIITCGNSESDEFRRQSKYFFKHLSSDKNLIKYFEMHNEDHYSIIGKLGQESNELFKQTRNMIKGC